MNITTATVIAGIGAGLVVGVWLHGRHYGGLACEARTAAAREATQRDLDSAAEDVARLTLDLAQAREDQRRRGMEADDAARANPDPCRAPDPGSLHRLRQRWAAD